MRKKVRKSLAFLLALALVVSVMSGLGLSVSADETAVESPVAAEEEQPVEETPKAEEKEEKTAEPAAESEKKDEEKAEGEGSGDTEKVATNQNGEQKQEEPKAESAAEEQDEPEEATASYLSTLSVQELYNYLTKLDDNNFDTAWKELSDSQKSEYEAYVQKMAFGNNETTTSYEGGAAAASMTNVAGLVSALTANRQGTLRNSPARAARVAASSVTLNTAAQAPDDGLHMSKSITKTKSDTSDTSYKICLESYATGQTTTSTVTKSVPCDIVLVLDQSGSMADDIKKVTFSDKAFAENQTNANVYDSYRDNLFVLVQDEEGNNKHVPITVTRNVTGSSYTDVTKSNSDWWYYYNGQSNSQCYYKTDEGTYKQVKSVAYNRNRGTYTYTYTCEDGTSFTSDEDWTQVILYQKNDTYSYTYSYKDSGENTPKPVTIEGNNSTIPTQTSHSTFFEGTTDGKLYYSEQQNAGTESKLNALKTAVTNFVSSVENDAAKNEVDHNIAIVGFASYNDQYNTRQNTEILTGVTITDNNGVEYNTDKANSAYKTAVGNALQNATTPAGKSSIQNAIDALDANGATRTDYGVDMAKDIFEAKTTSESDRYKDGKRNKVVVVFTDGTPTTYSEFNSTVANSAIDKAKKLKDGGATVYTIGIFDGADANSMNSNENKFMHYVSSNYPNAQDMQNPGTPSEKSGYYLTAANSSDLNSIFQKISQSISESSSKVKLTETTQVIDKMSADFKLPNNIDESEVKVYEVPCTGINADGSYTFGAKTELKDAVVSINEDAGTVSVSGFDYSAKYINKDSTEPIKGYKLVIEFPVEYKNEAWFGGNNIDSNDIGSGIYDDSGVCHGTFDVPEVNRAIDYKIAAKDQTIYVTNNADLQGLLDYFNADGKEYKPNGANNKYVDITYTLKQGETVVGTYTIKAKTSAENGTWEPATDQNWTPALEDCTTYTWTCTVKPTTAGKDALGVDGTANNPAKETPCDPETGTVHVLYPTVKAEDKTIYWGEQANAAGQVKDADVWKDKNSHSDIPKANGQKPTVAVTPEYVAGDEDETPASDVAYNVAVKVGDKDVTEVVRGMNGVATNKKQHKDWNCDDHADVDNKDYDFCIHVKSKKLTVVKEVTGNMGDTSQNFAFTGTNVYGGNKDFNLKDGKSETFKLKVGEEAIVTETKADGYTTTISDNANHDAGTADGLKYTYRVTRASPDAVTVTYTNDKTITPPSGIITTIAPYAIMVVLAAGAGVYFVYSRRRHNG